MIRPGIVSDAVVDGLVGVPGAFGAELPDGPAGAVLGVEVGDEAVEGVAVGELGVGLGGARAGCELGLSAGVRGREEEGGVRRDDVGSYVAQVEAGFVVFGARAGDDLAQEGGHCFGGGGRSCAAGCGWAS